MPAIFRKRRTQSTTPRPSDVPRRHELPRPITQRDAIVLARAFGVTAEEQARMVGASDGSTFRHAAAGRTLAYLEKARGWITGSIRRGCLEPLHYVTGGLLDFIPRVEHAPNGSVSDEMREMIRTAGLSVEHFDRADYAASQRQADAAICALLCVKAEARAKQLKEVQE